MTTKSLIFISFILTITLILVLISIIIVINLNKKLISSKNEVAMLVTKQLVSILNGFFEIKQLPQGETVHMELPLSKDKDNQTNNGSIKTEDDSVKTEDASIKIKVGPRSLAQIKPLFPTIYKTEPNNNVGTNIDPEFLHRVSSLIYREITNTDNIIEVISSELCMSSSQLNRRIKIMTGMTTSHLILVTRLNRAKKQLSLTQKPIGEIAVECGFNDFAYFSRSFKKEFEMTPTTFQRIPH